MYTSAIGCLQLTIKMLRDAGLKVWVLTGDKTETAINIAVSCNLISEVCVRECVHTQCVLPVVVAAAVVEGAWNTTCQCLPPSPSKFNETSQTIHPGGNCWAATVPAWGVYYFGGKLQHSYPKCTG